MKEHPERWNPGQAGWKKGKREGLVRRDDELRYERERDFTLYPELVRQILSLPQETSSLLRPHPCKLRVTSMTGP